MHRHSLWTTQLKSLKGQYGTASHFHRRVGKPIEMQTGHSHFDGLHANQHDRPIFRWTMQ